MFKLLIFVCLLDEFDQSVDWNKVTKIKISLKSSEQERRHKEIQLNRVIWQFVLLSNLVPRLRKHVLLPIIMLTYARTPPDLLRNLPPLSFYSQYDRKIELEILHLFVYLVLFFIAEKKKFSRSLCLGGLYWG